MRTSRTARYALHAALEMALAGDEPVTVAGVAGVRGLPQTALAKVFHRLTDTRTSQEAKDVRHHHEEVKP